MLDAMLVSMRSEKLAQLITRTCFHLPLKQHFRRNHETGDCALTDVT